MSEDTPTTSTVLAANHGYVTSLLRYGLLVWGLVTQSFVKITYSSENGFGLDTGIWSLSYMYSIKWFG